MSADPLLLPDGETSFHALRALKKIYVDKSDLVADIAFNLGFTKRPIFLSRPRRFGKSLLVSTFASVFKSQAEDFQGLKLEAIYAALPKPQQDAIQSCKTITLDFSTMDTESVAAFRRSFRSKLSFALSKADPAFTNDGSATSAGDLLDIYLSGCSDITPLFCSLTNTMLP